VIGKKAIADPIMNPSLAEGAAAVDASAAGAFEQYRNQLHRYLVWRLRSTQDAQDVAQDVYLRFLQISKQEAIREPQALLYRLASNLVYEFRVRAQRGHVTFDSQVAETMAERTEDVWRDELNERLSSARQLEAVLGRLPATYQAVLLLRKRDGLSPDEIALRMGLTKATVYTYLIRAVAQFKAHFRNMSRES
jgi:RNA polymerase sigma factor (sigma-70 family)